MTTQVIENAVDDEGEGPRHLPILLLEVGRAPLSIAFMICTSNDEAKSSVSLMVEAIFGSAHDHVMVQRIQNNSKRTATTRQGLQ